MVYLKLQILLASLIFSSLVQSNPMASIVTYGKSFHPCPPQIPKFRPCPLPFSFLKTQLKSKQRTSSLTSSVNSTSGKVTSPFSEPSSSSSTSGLYSAKLYDLTAENVNLVLDDVRPYLISDGGNVDVVSVEDGVISLKLQGACGTCPSSTTTMKMGIERVLKEKFGEAVKDIRQVSDDLQSTVTTVEAVNSHLDILRPAIKNYGGSVEVISVEGEDCHVRYVGPESIGAGIRAAIKERFPDIVNVVFAT